MDYLEEIKREINRRIESAIFDQAQSMIDTVRAGITKEKTLRGLLAFIESMDESDFFSDKKTLIHENEWPWGTSAEIIGYSGAGIVQLSFENSNPGVCYLSGLSVEKGYRRLGYATKLLEECEKYCRRKGGIFRIDLSSVQTDYVHQFYLKHGFVDIKEEDGFIQMYKMLKKVC